MYKIYWYEITIKYKADVCKRTFFSNEPKLKTKKTKDYTYENCNYVVLEDNEENIKDYFTGLIEKYKNKELLRWNITNSYEYCSEDSINIISANYKYKEENFDRMKMDYWIRKLTPSDLITITTQKQMEIKDILCNVK